MPPLARAEGAALLDRFRRYLRDHRLPVTRQRDLVAQIVFLSEDHPSVDAIIRRLRERNEAVGTATVYRTLEVLVESGLVRAHDFGEGFKRYEPMSVQAHHEHLICERCGNVVEFQNERLERMLPSHRRRARLPALAPPGGDLRRLPRLPPAGAGRALGGGRMNEPAALGFAVAFAAGLLSFLSPCVLPLVPSYVGFLTGMTLRSWRVGGAWRCCTRCSSWRGFSLVFILLGASATALGRALNYYQVWLQRVGGAPHHRLRAGLPRRVQAGVAGAGAPASPGAEARGVSSAPRWSAWPSAPAGRPASARCSGAILGLAATSADLSRGMLLLAVYSAGLAVPFLIAAIAVERFLDWFQRFRRSCPG